MVLLSNLVLIFHSSPLLLIYNVEHCNSYFSLFIICMRCYLIFSTFPVSITLAMHHRQLNGSVKEPNMFHNYET